MSPPLTTGGEGHFGAADSVLDKWAPRRAVSAPDISAPDISAPDISAPDIRKNFEILLKFSDFMNSYDCIGKITSESIKIQPVFPQTFFPKLISKTFFFL